MYKDKNKKRERSNEYYQENKDSILERQRKYRDTDERKQYMKEYREKNKEKDKEYQKQYRIENREVLLTQMSDYNKKWYKKNKAKKDEQGREWSSKPENKKKRVKYVQKYVKNNKEKVGKYNKEYGASLEGFYRRYKYRAKRANYEMKLTLEDFDIITTPPCKYCGENEKRRGIDRIDSSIGYVKDNCVACCGKCNMMKMKLNVDDFLNHIKKIYQHNI